MGTFIWVLSGAISRIFARTAEFVGRAGAAGQPYSPVAASLSSDGAFSYVFGLDLGTFAALWCSFLPNILLHTLLRNHRRAGERGCRAAKGGSPRFLKRRVGAEQVDGVGCEELGGTAGLAERLLGAPGTLCELGLQVPSRIDR